MSPNFFSITVARDRRRKWIQKLSKIKHLPNNRISLNLGRKHDFVRSYFWKFLNFLSATISTVAGSRACPLYPQPAEVAQKPPTQVVGTPCALVDAAGPRMRRWKDTGFRRFSHFQEILMKAQGSSTRIQIQKFEKIYFLCKSILRCLVVKMYCSGHSVT